MQKIKITVDGIDKPWRPYLISIRRKLRVVRIKRIFKDVKV